MPNACLEMVLMRQLASCLAVPILVVDRHLDLVFFNESAEPILGKRFEETGAIQRAEWSSMFQTSDAAGAEIPAAERPLAIAIDERKPAHLRFGLKGLDGMALPDWYDAFQPTDEDGAPIKQQDHPLNVARTRGQPCHARFFYRGLDGKRHGIEGTVFPLIGQCDRHLGAVGIFWEDPR